MADILQKTASSLVKRKLSLLFCRSFGQEWGMIGQDSLLPGWHWVLFGILLHLFCWNVLSQKGAKKRWTYVLIWDRHRCSHKVHITEEIKLHHTWLHTNRWQCQHFFFETDKKISWHATSVNQGKHVTEVSNSTKHMERAFCWMKKVFL